MQWCVDNQMLILGALWAVSELLSSVPSVKSNGVFQLISNILNTLIEKSKK